MRTLAVAVALAVVVVSCGDGGRDAEDAAAAERGATRPLVLTDPATTPPVDTTQAAVALDRVVFDTFDGSSIPLSEAGAADIERLFDAIEPIDGPDYETAAATDQWLGPDELVVGYVDDDGRAWAYPTRILDSHEIVNDELAGRPVLVSFCPLCGSGVVFDRRLDDRTLSFSNTSALHENDLVMVDRETGSYWWQVPGRAIVGPLTDAELVALPAETTTWSRWRERFPDTAVLARPEGRVYRSGFGGYAERLDAGVTPFPVDPAVLADPRLTPATRVVMAEIDDVARAWAAAPARTVSDTVGGVAVEVVTDGTGGRVLVDGEPIAVRSAFWFSVVSAYPEVTLGP